jgi:hypothetical protein
MEKKLEIIFSIFLIAIIGTVFLSAIADNTNSVASNHDHSDTFTAINATNVSLDYDNIISFGTGSPSACNMTTSINVANETITASNGVNVSLSKEYATSIILVTNTTGGETVGSGNYTFYSAYPNSKFLLTDAEYDGVDLNITYNYTNNLNATTDYTVYLSPGYFKYDSGTYSTAGMVCDYTYENITNSTAKTFINLLPLLFVIGMILFIIAKLKEENGDFNLFGGK